MQLGAAGRVQEHVQDSLPDLPTLSSELEAELGLERGLIRPRTEMIEEATALVNRSNLLLLNSPTFHYTSYFAFISFNVHCLF